MAPFGMNQLLRYAVCLMITTDMLNVSLPDISKPAGKVPLFVHGFGSHIFSSVLRSEPSLFIFEHALRIRVKAETSSSPAATPTATPEVHSEAMTPDSGSAVEINMVSEDAGGSSEETRSEQSTTTASSIKGKRKEEAPGSDSGKEDGDEPRGSSNLVGKINNLVSTDLENLVDGRDILLLGLSSFLPRAYPC